MNKKRVFLLLLVFILPFMFVINAKAEEYESIEKYICSESNKYKLINKVSKVKLSYEFISELTKEEIDSGYGPYFKVKVANMPEDVTLKMDAYTYTLKKDGDYFELKQRYSYYGGKVDLPFYGGSNTPCFNQYISTKSIKLPKYNVYSEKEECIEYEEFPMCNKFYENEIESDKVFYEKLEEYKKNIGGGKQKRQNVNVIDQIFSFIEDNQVLCAAIGLVLIVLIIIFIVRKIRRRMKRTKIKM